MTTMRHLLISLLCLQYCASASAQLTGMSLTGALVNTTNLSTSITSNSSFLVSGSPNGNVYQIELRKPGSTILLADGNSNFYVYTRVTVHTPDSLTFYPFSIPYNADPGIYSLYVGYLDPLMQGQFGPAAYFDSLPGIFTVQPPDGYLQGTVFEDLNQNGIQDAGELGLSNGVLNVTPGGQYSIASNGTFSIPAMNGTYTVTWQRNTTNNMYLTNNTPSYVVTVNNGNVTQLDFPLKRKLRFVSPNQLIAGQTVRVTLVGDTMVSSPYNVSFFRPSGGSTTIYNSSGNITVVDSNTLSIRVTVPAYSGTYNVSLRNNSAPYNGYHYLYGALTVIPSTATITGKVYYDANNNGQFDAGEPPLRGQSVHLMPDDAFAFTDYNGDYSIGAAFGNHVISMGTPNGQFTLSSGPASYSFSSTGPVSGKDFGLISTNPDYSSSTSLLPTRPRCNTNNLYTIRVTNIGNIPYNGRVYLMRDLQTVWNGSNPVADGSTASGDTIWWNLQNVQPFNPASIGLALLMPGPGTNIMNRVRFEAYDANNVAQLTSSQVVTETVLCSFDPNDKSCTPEGIGFEHYTLLNQDLEYLIRFQNTGNDTAYDVNIYDRLDTNLDWSSLQIVESSHSCITTLDSVGQVRFAFRNIYLPDSTVNEPASNGFIRYRIRPKAATPDFTLVENTAYIVFDLNPAVVTNTTYNTLVTQLPLWAGNESTPPRAMVVPNPVEHATRFYMEAGQLFDVFDVYSYDGRPVYHLEQSGGIIEFEKGAFPPGVYLFRFSTSSGTTVAAGRFMIR